MLLLLVTWKIETQPLAIGIWAGKSYGNVDKMYPHKMLSSWIHSFPSLYVWYIFLPCDMLENKAINASQFVQNWGLAVTQKYYPLILKWVLRLVKTLKFVIREGPQGKMQWTATLLACSLLGIQQPTWETAIQEQIYFLEINGKKLGETLDTPWGAQNCFV